MLLHRFETELRDMSRKQRLFVRISKYLSSLVCIRKVDTMWSRG